eukprot:2437711-Lingulodinium_polyedra.AAC.1
MTRNHRQGVVARPYQVLSAAMQSGLLGPAGQLRPLRRAFAGCVRGRAMRYSEGDHATEGADGAKDARCAIRLIATAGRASS